MTSYNTINTLEELINFSENFKVKEFALDTEFTNLDYFTQELISIQVYNPHSGFDSTHIQFNFDYTYTEKIVDPNGGRKKVTVYKKYEKRDAIDIDEAMPYLHKIMDGAKCIAANAKVERKILSKYGLTDWTICDDVNLMSWLLNCTTPSGLKDNAKRELKIVMPSYEATIGMKPNNINWNLVDFDLYAEYGAKDAYVTWMLREVYREQINSMQSLRDCYEILELPLIDRVAAAEMAGVRIDVPLLRAMSKEITKDIYIAEQRIYDLVGVEFNIGSPKQLGDILFARLGLKSTAKTPSGARSVGESVLKELAYKGVEVADYILDYRKLTKLKSTYIDAIPKMVDADGQLRGSLNQAGARTGRFSSSKPNLQNQPNNKDYPIKRAFIPRDGYVFIVVDWSTIEIRIMAHESQDPTMTRILKEGRDVHQETAENIYRQTGVKLTRSQGKTVNFAILFGMGYESLGYSLNAGLRDMVKKGTMTRDEYARNRITDQQAKQIIDGYMGAYSGFTNWGRREVAHSKKTGWVWTMGGRRRPVPELRNRKTYNSGARRVVNTEIQGGAGDLMKLGIIKLWEMYKAKGYDAETLLYVHDEYLIEVKKHQAKDLLKDVIHFMNNIFPECSVPILCEGDIFDNWAGLKQGKSSKESTYLRMKKLKLVR